MVVLNKKGFKLPRVEKDKFILLMRLGLAYNREQGMYSINSYNNIEKLCDTIAIILNVDEVSFTQTCIICGKDFACQDCKYNGQCETKNMPFQCVCISCLREDK